MGRITGALENIAIVVGFFILLGLIGWGADNLKNVIYPAEKQGITYDSPANNQYNPETRGQQ